MFNWLTRRRRKARDIFKYHDGVKTRWIDPLVAWDSMLDDEECNLLRDFAGSDRGEEDSVENIINMACRVFHVEKWSENAPGLTKDELNTLVFDFMQFMEHLKKKRSPSPTQSEHSVSV